MKSVEITGVCERDVDLLLLEEFVASEAFVSWFAAKIGLSAGRLAGCARSVTSSTGESDLDLTLDVGDHIVKVLIENKVDAMFQPRQPERYRERAASYVRNGTCETAITVIIAPSAYFPDETETFGFDHRLTHEVILAWFEGSDDTLGPRARYKSALLTGAINRGGAGWQLIPDEAATDFWYRYWNEAKTIAADLRMPRPSAKPAGSGFIRIKPLGLPRGVQLLHKVRYGNVDLQFAGKGDRVAELEAQYGAQLPSDARIEQAAQSAVVRRTVPLIDMSAPFVECQEAVRSSLKAALELLAWYRRVAK